jgi:hypothetical protein
VFFSDAGAKKAYKIGLDGTVSPHVAAAESVSGQAFGADGKLYAVAGGASKVLAFGMDGKAAVFADGFRGNDLTIGNNGGMYVTNPGADGASQSKVWYISPKGDKRVVDSGLKFPNGIALSPDQSLLYVSDYRSHWVYSYQIGSDGTLRHKQRYFHLHAPDTADDAGGDGMCVDRNGRLWVATHMGLQVCDQAGRVLCIIPTPNRRVAHVCIGGEGFDTLFAFCGDRVYKRAVKVKGVLPCQAPFKPAAPRL